MGAIQQALSGVANTGLAAAGSAAIAKGAKAQQETQKLVKEQQEFNAEMQAAELPVKEAEAKLDASEAGRQQELQENTLQYQKKAEDIRKVTNKILEDPTKDPGKYEDLGEKRRQKAAAEHKEREKVINMNYDQAKLELSKEVYTEQAKAKSAQAKLIEARIKQIRGGKQ